MSHESSLSRPKSLLELFVAFTALALQGFGGVLAVSQRMLCEQKRWLSPTQFVEVLAVANVLPGPAVCNIALLIGDRFFGWRGALIALAGLMTLPLAVVLVLTAFYVEFASVPAVANALKGVSAAAAGLIGGTALRLAHTLRDNPMRLPVCLALSAATFVMAALLRWPLVWTCVGLGAIAFVFAWQRVQALGDGDQNGSA